MTSRFFEMSMRRAVSLSSSASLRMWSISVITIAYIYIGDMVMDAQISNSTQSVLNRSIYNQCQYIHPLFTNYSFHDTPTASSHG